MVGKITPTSQPTSSQIRHEDAVHLDGTKVNSTPNHELPNTQKNNSLPPQLKVSSNFDPPRRHNRNINTTQNSQSNGQQNANQNANPLSSSNTNSKVQTKPPHPVSKPSFSAMVSAALANSSSTKQPMEITHGTHMGKPTVYFSAHDYFVTLAEECKFTIVGKFTRGKPSMEEVRRLFISHIPLKGSVKIAFYDANHVYIDFTNEADFYHIYSKPFITLGPYIMKVIRWTPDFSPECETTISPVWILIHQLPWHLFRWDTLSRMVSSIGNAMAPDMATYSKSRGNVAKLKVEINLLKPRQDQIWLGFKRLDSNEEDGYWLYIEYEGAPSYCQYCCMQGHDLLSCRNKKRDEEVQAKASANIEEINDQWRVQRGNKKLHQHIIGNTNLNMLPQQPHQEVILTGKNSQSERENQPTIQLTNNGTQDKQKRVLDKNNPVEHIAQLHQASKHKNGPKKRVQWQVNQSKEQTNTHQHHSTKQPTPLTIESSQVNPNAKPNKPQNTTPQTSPNVQSSIKTGSQMLPDSTTKPKHQSDIASTSVVPKQQNISTSFPKIQKTTQISPPLLGN
ncbi:hypothetical protein A4A49_28080 [Nicotiana attenuata]|uniref:DUF4283 domain-containing protein n=1 Tax=Nicotiana attenuata TaxID=49451 RepID=A0A1J6ICX2_NICAT|nr:hypothetical protein A4A49_28080 [Nicotiana attenuata]